MKEINLIKEQWQAEDIVAFQAYLQECQNSDKIEWTQRIINTSKPVLALKSKQIQDLAKQIAQGNFRSFLDLQLNEYHENTLINGYLIMLLKDFSEMESYLRQYAEFADNWATCDTLRFKVNQQNKILWWQLAQDLIKAEKPFTRRIGLRILFKFVNDEEYLPQIFQILNTFKTEQEYYVNMVNAWLICECFIKQPQQTTKFLDNHQLNKFTINKAISKCRDSFRVSDQDKEMLLKYRQK